MKGLFSIDSKFGRMFYQLGQLILLSFFWLLFSIPVVTCGPACCALYVGCRKVLIEREGKLFDTFWKAFKQNFKQGFAIGIFTIIFIVVVLYCALLMLHMDMLSGVVGTIGGIIYLIVVVAVLVFLQYVTSYITWFDDKLKTVVYNCVYISLVHFEKTLRLAFQLVVAGVCFYFFDLIRYLPILMMLLPSGYCVLTVGPLEKVFKQYLPKEEPETETEE